MANDLDDLDKETKVMIGFGAYAADKLFKMLFDIPQGDKYVE